MELFLELASTIILTVLLCYIIGKLISSAPSGDGDSRMAVFECKFSVGSEIRGLESEGRVGFVEKVSQVEESGGEPVPEKSFAVRGFPDGSFGSPGLRNVSGTEEGEGEGESVVEEGGCGGNGGFSGSADNLFDESSERERVEEFEVCLRAKDEVGLAKSDEIEVMEFDEGEKNGADDVKRGLFDEEEDDWVGIERTELERLFGAAMVYVGFMSNADRVSVLDNDVKMKLYGLHKIATQGPCLEPQPMALKVSARAKWNAWQKLGEMTPEMAMEQYISLLSECVPGWMQDAFGEDDKQDFIDAWEFGKLDVLKTFVNYQPVVARDERKLEELKPLR